MQHFDLCVIGSGSANSILDERFESWSVAMVEQGTFGGTCLNVGCIPTKMYVYPADLAASPTEAAGLGVDLHLDGVRWADVRDRIFTRIDAISAGGRKWRRDNPNVTLFERPGRFVGPRTLQILGRDGEPDQKITADRFVIGAGSRPVVPPFAGLDSVTYHTSDTVMRLPERPDRLVIVGGGYVAAEFAHIFASFGTRVTVLARSQSLLKTEDTDVVRRFTEQLGAQVDVRLGHQVSQVSPGSGGQGITVTGRRDDGGEFTVEADVLLLATGRVPNADTLDLDETGVRVDDGGYIVVDAQQRTTADGIYALGDVSSPLQLKHVANHEARVVQHNLLHPDAPRESDHRFVPHAVFSHPQVASVGLTEQAALEQGVDFAVGCQDYAGTAYGWAMEDAGHFVKVLADPATGRLLGAHLIGPQASSMIQPLIQAMHFGTPAHDVARGQYWIHPAMIEVVENALLQLPSTPRP